MSLFLRVSGLFGRRFFGKPATLSSNLLRVGGLATAFALAAHCSDRVEHVKVPVVPPPGNPSVRLSLAADVPDFLDVPFPSDIYLRDGKIVDALPRLDRVFVRNSEFISHELARMNGFSRIAMSEFYLDDPSAEPLRDGSVATALVNPDSLPITETDCVADGSSVFLVDLEATDPASARVSCRAEFHTDQSGSDARPSLAIGPARGIVLQEGRRYAAVVTARVRTTNGQDLDASKDFQAILDGDRSKPASSLYGAAVDKVRELLGPALASTKIVGIAPFTTKTSTRELFTLREAMDQEPVPVLKWDEASLAPMKAAKFARAEGGVIPPGFTASLDAWFGVATEKLPDGVDDPNRGLPVRAHDRIASIGTAVFEATNFLSAKGGSYEDPDFGTFLKDANGAIVKSAENPKVKIWVTISVPITPPPPTGYPAVIYQHGLNGSRHDFLGYANALAAKGWVGVAIDSVTFGARAPTAIYLVDDATDYQAAPGATYAGGDGISDMVRGGRNGSFELFGGLKNLGAIRDQFRQAALDTVQLVRVLREAPDLSPLMTTLTPVTIDPDRVAYFGESLGGVQGAMAATIEPNVKQWTFNVAGGGLLSELAAYSPSIAVQLGLAAGLNFGITNAKLNSSHPFVTLAQLIAEDGDPLAYAEFLVRRPQTVGGVQVSPRNILQMQVLFDEVMSNESNEALARAAGYGIALPNAGTNAQIRDIKNPLANVHRTPLPDVAPDANGFISDTPIAGTTAVLVQCGPGGHGNNLHSRTVERLFKVPYAQFDTKDPYPMLNETYRVRTAYRELQGTMTQFFQDGFEGRVPRVSGFKAAVRDNDDDGALDDVDSDSNDPAVQ